MSEVVLFDIQHGSFVDGPGMRTTVFFKGCNLRCGWCHNPESQSFLPELLYDRSLCTDCGLCKKVCKHPESCVLCGDCAEICLNQAKRFCGKRWSVGTVMEELLRDRLFYEQTGGGVTFSGGECMLQLEGLEELLKRCWDSGIHTAVDTAGHVPWSAFARILPVTDLFLYDVKCLDSRTHLEHTGVDNRMILENLRKLLENGKEVIIRIPVVAGVNDDPDQMRELAQMICGWGRPSNVELLPCHSMGSTKYKALGRSYGNYRAPDESRIEELCMVLTQEGLRDA